jgi:hypothetical protein
MTTENEAPRDGVEELAKTFEEFADAAGIDGEFSRCDVWHEAARYVRLRLASRPQPDQSPGDVLSLHGAAGQSVSRPQPADSQLIEAARYGWQHASWAWPAVETGIGEKFGQPAAAGVPEGLCAVVQRYFFKLETNAHGHSYVKAVEDPDGDFVYHEDAITHEADGLTSKQAWWAGARAGLGVPADMPRKRVADLLGQRVVIDVYQQDWMPGFAAFLDDGSLAESGRPKFAINLGAFVASVSTGDIEKSEIPYFVAETLMHEVIHVIEKWAGAEFSEERVDALIEKYTLASRPPDPLDAEASGSVLPITVKSERITSEYTRRSVPAVTCTWTLDPIDESWDTGCGEKHQFTDGGPAENSHRFCPYCSGALRAALESLDV